jgi:hypothetical protein
MDKSKDQDRGKGAMEQVAILACKVNWGTVKRMKS